MPNTLVITECTPAAGQHIFRLWIEGERCCCGEDVIEKSQDGWLRVQLKTPLDGGRRVASLLQDQA